MPTIYAKHNGKIYEGECNVPRNGFKLKVSTYNPEAIVSPSEAMFEECDVVSLEFVEVFDLPNIHFIATNNLEDDFFPLMQYATNNHPLSEENYIRADIYRKHNDYIIKIRTMRYPKVFEKTYTHTFPIREPFQYQNESVVTMYEVRKDIKHLFSGEYTDSVLNKILHVFRAFVDANRDYRTIVFCDTESLLGESPKCFKSTYPLDLKKTKEEV